jgi:hypothetical protein
MYNSHENQLFVSFRERSTKEKAGGVLGGVRLFASWKAGSTRCHTSGVHKMA